MEQVGWSEAAAAAAAGGGGEGGIGGKVPVVALRSGAAIDLLRSSCGGVWSCVCGRKGRVVGSRGWGR